MSRNYEKRCFDLSANSWTPITAPIACNVFWVKAPADADIYEDTTGAGTHWDTISANVLQYIPEWDTHSNAAGFESRFSIGETITYLKSSNGSKRVVVTFIR